MDIADIGAAIALRFKNLTPPTGYKAIQFSTHRRQLGLGKLPAAVTSWVATRDLNIAFYERWGFADFTTTLYFEKGKAEDDDATLQAWHDVVVDALVGQIQLGEWGAPNGVDDAQVRSVTPGEEQLGEPYYAALEVVIEVRFKHPVAAAA